MFFSNNKKLQRDRNAGLVFRWRGGYALNRVGSSIAFIITSLLFAGGFIVLNVYAKPNTVPNRYRASMIQLGAMDDDLTWWIERNSPNLPEWKENTDEQSVHRVNTLLMEDIKNANNEAYQYADVEMQQIEINQEEIYSLSSRGLPPVERFKIPDQENAMLTQEVNWELKIQIDGPLAARLPEGLKYEDWISDKWRGKNVRLILAVDAGGKVISVNPADWNESKTVREFENWAYTINFKPADDEKNDTVIVGVLHLSYTPVMEVNNNAKEDQP